VNQPRAPQGARNPTQPIRNEHMSNIANNLIAAFTATFDADAQDLLTAAKHAIARFPMDDDAVYVTLDFLKREAQERIDFGDEPDPMLHDVLACIAEFYNT
jgi:hypothetical protein